MFGPKFQESFRLLNEDIKRLVIPPHSPALVSKGLRSKRYSVNKLSESEFTISISNVTFKDGGNYTCSQYGDHTTETIVELTVLGENNVAMLLLKPPKIWH